MLRVIARRGSTTYLLTRETDIVENPQPVGRVLNAERKVLLAPINIHSLLGRGYWREAELTPEETEALLASVEIVEGPSIEEPWTLPGLYYPPGAAP
jgi:hypothetical protein